MEESSSFDGVYGNFIFHGENYSDICSCITAVRIKPLISELLTNENKIYEIRLNRSSFEIFKSIRESFSTNQNRKWDITSVEEHNNRLLIWFKNDLSMSRSVTFQMIDQDLSAINIVQYSKNMETSLNSSGNSMYQLTKQFLISLFIRIPVLYFTCGKLLVKEKLRSMFKK